MKIFNTPLSSYLGYLKWLLLIILALFLVVLGLLWQHNKSIQHPLPVSDEGHSMSAKI